METQKTYAKGEKEAQELVEGLLAGNPGLKVERVPFKCDCGMTHKAFRVTDRAASRQVSFIIPCNQMRMEF